MKYLLAILFITLLYFSGLSQKQGQPLVDSLLLELPKMTADSNKVKLLSRISQVYYTLNPMKCFSYAEQGLELAEKLQWKRGMANLSNNLGLFISDTGNNKLARDYFDKSYELNKEIGASVNIINNLNNIGRTYQSEADFTRAADYFFKALVIAEEIKNNEQIALVGTNLTATFYKQNDYPKAKKYGEMALKNAEIAKHSRHIITSLLLLGTTNYKLGDTTGAKIQLNRALKLSEETSNYVSISNILTSLSTIEYPNYKKQVELLERAKKIFDEINPNSITAATNTANLAEAYHKLSFEEKSPQKEFAQQKAREYLLQAKRISEQISDPEFDAKFMLILADFEEDKGNYKTALAYYKRVTAINDSLYSQAKKNEIAGLEGTYNIAIKDKELAINKLLLNSQRKTQIGLLAGLVLLSVIGGLLFWQASSRKKTNTTLMVLNNQLDEANKIKARFFGILSHDLRSPVANLINFLQFQKNEPESLSAEQKLSHQQNISESAENLLSNMEAMLLWSKEQMADFKPKIKTIPVADLFDYLQKYFGQTEQTKISYDHEPGLSVSADENYLRVIMQNLTSNAVKVLKNAPGGTISWNAKQEGNSTILSITDNGPGINADQVKALYNEDSMGVNERTGFGFHLIRDLAKAIRYTISIQSQPGLGTTFILSA
jgi:signal transduction histidine kinase